jgi:hypothetical protein
MSDSIQPAAPENAGARLVEVVRQLGAQTDRDFDSFVDWLANQGGLARMALAHENAGVRLAHAFSQLGPHIGVEFDTFVSWLTDQGGLATMALQHFRGNTLEQQTMERLRQCIELPSDATLSNAWREIRRRVKAHDKPLDVLLFCPACKRQHIDAPEWPHWKNPPHRTHVCTACHTQWTPADMNTNGVLAIKPGSSANWPMPAPNLFAIERLPARDEMGFTYHPDIPNPEPHDEEQPITPYLWAIGWDGYFLSAEADMTDAAYDAAVDSSDFTAWTPAQPEGEGWRLAAIYDTENGPYALFVRPFPHLIVIGLDLAAEGTADFSSLETSETDARPAA